MGGSHFTYMCLSADASAPIALSRAKFPLKASGNFGLNSLKRNFYGGESV